MTIDKDGVLMTSNFDKCKFELIDKVIENLGELSANEVPKELTAVVVPCEQQAKKDEQKQPETPQK